MTPEQLLTVAEFAALVRMDAKTVYRLVARGELAGVIRVGRAIRIDASVSLKSSRAENDGQVLTHAVVTSDAGRRKLEAVC
ncbi:MAG: helix-turn-helix domain-containing protein [Vicinamibacterales bacterium]